MYTKDDVEVRNSIFSCEEAALEGQSQVYPCLCVCMTDPKTEC